MKRSPFALALGVFLALPVMAANDPAPRAIQLPDILAWKRIVAPVISNDGAWFAYRVSPNEGDSEVVIRNLKDGKDQHYPIGEIPQGAAGGPPPGFGLPPRDLVISEDNKWAAFLAYPTAKEAKGLKKQKKPVQSRVILVDLAAGTKTEFDKVRRFAFSGERSTMLALHRYGPDGAGPNPAAMAAAAAAPAAGPNAPAPPERPTGTDLLLYDLASATELNVGNVSEFAFDKKGDYLAWIIDATDKAGNGIELRNMSTGMTMALDNAKASYKGIGWTEKGDGLATLRGVEDKEWEDKLYSVVAFKNFTASAAPKKISVRPCEGFIVPHGNVDQSESHSVLDGGSFRGDVRHP